MSEVERDRLDAARWRHLVTSGDSLMQDRFAPHARRWYVIQRDGTTVGYPTPEEAIDAARNSSGPDV